MILTHQLPLEVAMMLRWWKNYVPEESLFVAYGGVPEYFGEIRHPQKCLIQTPRLRTKDHQREKQSYSDIFCAAKEWMRSRDFDFVHFAEYDHLPLVKDVNERQKDFLQGEGADVLGFRLRRVDGTNYPNYLLHAADPQFAGFWRQVSVRSDPSVVLRTTGTGTFWTRAAFDAVAAYVEPFPMYMEIYLPTLAHHLGFRVRDWGAQNAFVHHQGDFTSAVEALQSRGAWTAHPIKQMWSNPAQTAL